MSVTTEHLSNYLNELDSYMKRLERDGLSKKDRKLFLDLNNEYYDVFQQTDEFPKEVLQGMAEFGDNIINQSDNSKELAGRYRDNIVQYANDYMDTSLRSELQFGIFQKDAEILSLQHEKIQMLQGLVDLDMKSHEHITDLTQDILEAQSCEVLNGRVREVGLWEQMDHVPDIAGHQAEAEAQNKVEKMGEPMEQEQQRVKLKFPYMTRETFIAVKDEIKRMGAIFDPGHKAWYVNQGAGKETATAIQDYIAGHDEAIYLQLPSVGPKEFKNMIEQLKHDGARYNSDKKAWFITEKTDRSKFEQFLPAEKDSVHEKLNAYKFEAGKQHKDHHEKGDRRKEVPELA